MRSKLGGPPRRASGGSPVKGDYRSGRARAARRRRRPRRACARRACAGSRRRGGRRFSRTGRAARRSRRCASPARQAEHLELARGQPGRVLRVAGRGPRGSPCAPRWRRPAGHDRRRRPAPSRCSSSRARRSASSSSALREGERGLVGRAELAPEARGRVQSPASSAAYGSASPGGSSLLDRRRAGASTQARRSPSMPAADCELEGGVRSPRQRASRRPSSQSASARAAASGSSRRSSPVGSARAQRLVERGQMSGSPRRARTSPSTASATDARAASPADRGDQAGESAASSQRP